jgi:hypothetical protein
MSFQKSFGFPGGTLLGEAARLELRADMFNIFNNLNLVDVSNSIGSSPTAPNTLFGQAQRGLAGRVINLQARFSF